MSEWIKNCLAEIQDPTVKVVKRGLGYTVTVPKGYAQARWRDWTADLDRHGQTEAMTLELLEDVAAWERRRIT